MFDRMIERAGRARDDRDTMGEENRLLKELSDRIRTAAEEAESHRSECAEVGRKVELLAQMLRTIVIISNSTPTIYDRPIRRIVSEAAKNLERALTLVRKCKRSGVLRRVVTIINIINFNDFRKVFSLLDASLGDMSWLLSIFNSDAGAGGAIASGASIVLSLPPIASIDPILAWVWSYVAVIQTGGVLADRIEAANALASLAVDNDRNKKIIIEEGGVPPLLKLLNESGSADGQIAAATALANLATDGEKTCQIAAENGVPIIVHVLGDSPMRVQVCVASLVARMAANDSNSQEEFARENAIRPLVSLLSFEILIEPQTAPNKPTSIHSLVQINKEMVGAASIPFHLNSLHSEGGGSSRGREHHRKERENEKPEVKLQLKVNCAEALWMLARGSINNSRRITETKGLLCLAKIIEKEQGDLQLNCLMTVMEITSAAETNADLRRSAFKTNSPPAKAVVNQLLRVIQESGNPKLQIPAINSIGSLARTFPARETRVIRPLVNQLSHRNADVAAEAVIALGKFTCPDNFLHIEHSKAIIEFDGLPPLMRLLRSTEKAQLHALILLCYLALHVPNSEALQEARALTALELASRNVSAQHPTLKELIPEACRHLELFHAGPHCLRPS